MKSRFFLLLAALSSLAAASPALAQHDSARVVTLDEAIRIAQRTSESVRIAEAGLTRARGDQMRARSLRLPQVYATGAYTKTLKSQFSSLRSSAPPDTSPPSPAPPCDQYLNPSGTSDQRIGGLETAVQCATGVNPFAAFSNLPFGRENQYNLGLSVSQSLFAGGRINAQNAAAGAERRAADVGVVAARAALTLEVTQAYYDAVLGERLYAIADSSLAQTESALKQTTLARNVGNTSEFELLRARVTRDNQRPLVIERRKQRDLAMLRLKQLLEIPLTTPLRLATGLPDEGDSVRVAVNENVALTIASRRVDSIVAHADTAAENRATVRQAHEAVIAQQSVLRATRAARLPSVNVSSAYGKVAYPNSGLPGWSDFLNNWTVTLGTSIPLFTGGRQRGDELVARAAVEEATARLDQARELAALDARSAVADLEEAEAQYAASAGTANQAARAYTIADVRYREGISTQLELSESRVLLQSALANRAYAARNLQVARMRLSLLRDLPLGTGGFGGGAGTSSVPQSSGSSAAPNSSGASTAADPTQTSAGGQTP